MAMATAMAMADTAGSSWDDVLNDELKIQDEFCADVESCDVVRTPSDGDSSATASCHSSQGQPCTWWAVVLKAAGRELGFSDVESDPPSSQSGNLRVVSACSGCSAESWALKACWSVLVPMRFVVQRACGMRVSVSVHLCVCEWGQQVSSRTSVGPVGVAAAAG